MVIISDERGEGFKMIIYAFYFIYKLSIEEIAALYNVDINEVKEILKPYENYDYKVSEKERRMFSVY